MYRASCLFIALLVGQINATEPPGTVEQIIEQLGKSDPKARVAARLALEKLGPEALPALRKAAASEDPEVRRRADDLVKKIDGSMQSEKILKPTSIHLIYKDTPVSEAVADFARKSK